MKPRIALFTGDPTGIGSEIVVKLLDKLGKAINAHILVVGDKAVFARAESIARTSLSLTVVDTIADADFSDHQVNFLHRPTNGVMTPGQVSQVAGYYVLQTLTEIVDWAKEGQVDAICFAPLNKQAMHLAGSPYEDDLQLLAAQFGVDSLCREINVLDDLWTTRVTSHIPLNQVAQNISADSVFDMIAFTHHQLRQAGHTRQRIAIAALNPHGGEGGLFGREEIDIIQPAIEKAQAHDIDAHGPFPADTVFLKGRNGDYDAIVTLYHDQGQIAMKLMGFERGVTVHGGLPIPVVTPAHGTAFDIVGQGIANVEALHRAFSMACQMSKPGQA